MRKLRNNDEDHYAFEQPTTTTTCVPTYDDVFMAKVKSKNGVHLKLGRLEVDLNLVRLAPLEQAAD